MPKPWRLTCAAETSLVDIAVWTTETFGPRQAAAYEEDLISACDNIAAGNLVSQECRRLIDKNLAEDLRFVRVGQHFGLCRAGGANHCHRFSSRTIRFAKTAKRTGGTEIEALDK